MTPPTAVPAKVNPKVLLISFLAAPILMGIMFLNPSWEPLRSLTQSPGWIPVGRVIGSAVVLLMLWSSWRYEHHVKPRTADLLRQKGMDPEQIGFLITTAECMSGAVVGMILYMLGTSITEFWCFASISIVAILFWAWRYRTFLLQTPTP